MVRTLHLAKKSIPRFKIGHLGLATDGNVAPRFGGQLPVQQFNECTFRKLHGLRGIWPRGARLLWKRFPTPFESNHLIVECECTSVCGPLIPKIQFNGIGGLLTYITLIPNTDVSV